jgi:hypothetical protein
MQDRKELKHAPGVGCDASGGALRSGHSPRDRAVGRNAERVVGDFNGDGRDDIALIGNSAWQCGRGRWY